MIRFFKKHGPQFRVTLSNGSALDFTSLDSMLGYFATEVPYIHDEFAKFAAERRYGIAEISEGEFHADYVQKKSRSPALGRIWREEVGVGAIRGTTLLAQLGTEHVGKVAAVDTKTNGGLEGTKLETAPVVAEAVKQEFKPAVGKRRKKT